MNIEHHTEHAAGLLSVEDTRLHLEVSAELGHDLVRVIGYALGSCWWK